MAHLDKDCYNPTGYGKEKVSGFTPEERGSFDNFLKDKEWFDSYRQEFPDEDRAFTYFSARTNARASGEGWRLDYFICSPEFKGAVYRNAIHDNIYGSDHVPISCNLDLFFNSLGRSEMESLSRLTIVKEEKSPLHQIPQKFATQKSIREEGESEPEQ